MWCNKNSKTIIINYRDINQLMKSYSLLERLLAREIYNNWVMVQKKSGYVYVYKNDDDLISTKFEHLQSIHTVYEYLHIAHVLYKGISNGFGMSDTCAMTHDAWISHNQDAEFSAQKSYTKLSRYNKKYYKSVYRLAYNLYWEI